MIVSVLSHQLTDRPRLRALRSRPALLAAGLCLVAVSGCGAGITNETQQETSVIQGATVTVGNIFISDIYITPVGQQTTQPAGVSLAPTTDVTESAPPGLDATPSGAVAGYLVASLVNNSNSTPDELLGINTSGVTATLAPAGKALTIQPNGTLDLNDPAATHAPYILLTEPVTALQIGTNIPVTFDFEGAGESKTIEVPVTTSDAGAPPASPPGVAIPTTSGTASPTTSAH